MNTMRIYFYNVRNLVLRSEFFSTRQTVNQIFYLEVFKRLRNGLRWKRPDLWQSGNWLFHYDNAPNHIAFPMRRFFTKNCMTTMRHLSYSPVFYLFLLPRMNRYKERKRFVEIKTKTTKTQSGITKKKKF